MCCRLIAHTYQRAQRRDFSEEANVYVNNKECDLNNTGNFPVIDRPGGVNDPGTIKLKEKYETQTKTK